MPWNSNIEQQYQEMLDGVIGQAIEPLPIDFITSDQVLELIYKPSIMYMLRSIEEDFSPPTEITPSNQKYLTKSEAQSLHILRIAWACWMERTNVWPWKLQDKSLDELRPLLGFQYQGFHPNPQGHVYTLHSVWDVKPGDLVARAIFAYAIWQIVGKQIETEGDTILQLIQGMRDFGWEHVSGWYENYAGYTEQSKWSWDLRLF